MVVDGSPNQVCGDGCRYLVDHTCDSGTVYPLPLLEGAYEIRAWDRYESFDYEVINGRDGGFFTGRPVCMQCPSDFLELCNAVEKIVVLLEDVVLDAACIGINIATGRLYGRGPFAWQYD
ncbi:hypothetical protein SLS58_006194 [Diplodia intermedia]|uniref:Uncharacterized protein n=1 Tax=Diplodia intermedia TaxID=856260 RepID=A0ABR3TNP0_9PEZI